MTFFPVEVASFCHSCDSNQNNNLDSHIKNQNDQRTPSC